MIKNLGFEYYSGSEIREQFQSMNSNRNVVITEILYKVLRKINTKANDKAIDEAADIAIRLCAGTLILNLYFQLIIGTMNEKSPEVIELAKFIRQSPSEVVRILHVYASFDPFVKVAREEQDVADVSGCVDHDVFHVSCPLLVIALCQIARYYETSVIRDVLCGTDKSVAVDYGVHHAGVPCQNLTPAGIGIEIWTVRILFPHCHVIAVYVRHTGRQTAKKTGTALNPPSITSVCQVVGLVCSYRQIEIEQSSCHARIE